jgi:alkylhydroperoxidase family enzyme
VTEANATQADGTGFLEAPASTAGAQQLYDSDVQRLGFVMNLSSLWGHHPSLHAGLSRLLEETAHLGQLTLRQRAVLIASCASTLGDSYCSIAWGRKLAKEAGAEVAADVLRGTDERLDPAERALARWARTLTRDPSGTAAADLQPLRDAGFADAQIFAVTVFVALRLAFAVVNDSLGARPDAELCAITPAAVRDAVTFGRPPVADTSSA